MGHHSFSLHGLEPDHLHTSHFTGRLPTGYMPIIHSSASRLASDRIGLCHFVIGLEPDHLHTSHFTGRLPRSSLVCGQGE